MTGNRQRTRATSQRIQGHRPRNAGVWKFWMLAAACLFGCLLFIQASALPIHVGLLLLPPHTAAMTHGCAKGTCCTPFCFVDKSGMHHCVHMQGDSCDCGLSTNDPEANPIFLSALITLPVIEDLFPVFEPAGWIRPSAGTVAGRYPAIPTPPPRESIP